MLATSAANRSCDELNALAPVRAVFGNTDLADDPSLQAAIDMVVDGLSIHVSHGHEIGAPTPERLLRAYPADIIVLRAHAQAADRAIGKPPGREPWSRGSEAIQTAAQRRTADHSRGQGRTPKSSGCNQTSSATFGRSRGSFDLRDGGRREPSIREQEIRQRERGQRGGRSERGGEPVTPDQYPAIVDPVPMPVSKAASIAPNAAPRRCWSTCCIT